jgi:hypothetical protein
MWSTWHILTYFDIAINCHPWHFGIFWGSSTAMCTQKFFPNVGQREAPGATVTVTDPKFLFGKRFASASFAGFAVSRHCLWRARFLQRLPLGPVRCCRTAPKRTETHGPSFCIFSRCRWSYESEGRQEIEMEKDESNRGNMKDMERWVAGNGLNRYAS